LPSNSLYYASLSSSSPYVWNINHKKATITSKV
jgi:hypothetical protein